MSDQDDNLERVTLRIRGSILAFKRTSPRDFYAEQLRHYVHTHAGQIAPGSPDRVLRQLRREGVVNYVVLSRSHSLYRWVPVGQARLF